MDVAGPALPVGVATVKAAARAATKIADMGRILCKYRDVKNGFVRRGCSYPEGSNKERSKLPEL